MQKASCKICRRLGVKLFLKGEKCLSPKCPMIRKPYPPGAKKSRRARALSEYGKELREKQKLKNWYNLREKQFRNYVKDVFKKRGSVEDAASFLIEKLESRFDNVVFRLGLAHSRPQARQLISHGHFLLNGRTTNIPSRQLKKGDIISIHPSSQGLPFFRNISNALKKYEPPVWLRLKPDKIEGEVIGKATLETASPPAEISAIFEYYSR